MHRASGMIKEFWDVKDILETFDATDELRKAGLRIYSLNGSHPASRLCPFCTSVSIIGDPEILFFYQESNSFVCKKCKSTGDFIDLMSAVLFRENIRMREERLILVTGKLGIYPSIPKGTYRDRKGRKFLCEKVILGEVDLTPDWFVVYRGAKWKESRVMKLIDFFRGYGSIKVRSFVPD